MGTDRIPEARPPLELPNVAGLRVLIRRMKDAELPLKSGMHDSQIHKLKQQIEHVVASEEEIDGLKTLFDSTMTNLLFHAVREFPSEADLRRRIMPEGVLRRTRNAALAILSGIQNLPFFDENTRAMLSITVRIRLVQKGLIKPSQDSE